MSANVSAQQTLLSILEKFQCISISCLCHRSKPDKATTHCPAHSDQHPSLTVNLTDGKLLVHCQAGCDQNAVIKELKSRNLWPGRTDRIPQRKPDHTLPTLEALANDKGLPREFLVDLGLYDLPRGGVPSLTVTRMELMSPSRKERPCGPRKGRIGRREPNLFLMASNGCMRVSQAGS